MKYFLLSIGFLVGFASAMAQKTTDFSPEEKEVIKPISLLFEGMFKGDSSMVRKAFYKDALLKTVYKNKEGKALLVNDDLTAILASIAKPHDQPYIEKVLSYDIKIDDNLAQVWTPYEFYVGEQFSHCGVNAFQLFKTEEGWKIIAVTDTRRREGCK